MAGLSSSCSSVGPLGGDALRIGVRVDPGVSLVVRSAVATIAGFPGPGALCRRWTSSSWSPWAGSLSWLPEPLLLVAGADHRMTTRIRLDPRARLVVRDVVVRGRHRERSGSLRQRLVVDVDDRPLLRNELRLGPRWPGADGPAGAGDAVRVAQTLLVGAGPSPPPGGDSGAIRAATMTIAEGVELISEVARDAGALVGAPDTVLHAVTPPR